MFAEVGIQHRAILALPNLSTSARAFGAAGHVRDMVYDCQPATVQSPLTKTS